MSSLKHLTSQLKHLHSFFFAPKQAFTLVELIVVISVLGVLATIAFTQVSNVTLSARNSTRMTNIQSISSSLDIYKATNWIYPIPDNKTDILYSGSIIWYQWYIKDTAARLLKLSPAASQDPLNISTYFSYATNQSRTHAQLLGFLEANTTSFKALPATFASDELNTKTPYSKWEELGILYTTGTTTPLAWTSIELNTTTNPYTAYYNSTDSLSWTGNLLQNLVISYAHGSGFGSPTADDCPTGFIPVPGNKDFNQPGFCVAKYEMKQAVGNAEGYNLSGVIWSPNPDGINTYCPSSAACVWVDERNFSQPIVSKAEGNPLVNINQYNAIEACKSMWEGYHLITNNEWMAAARNIESTALNWSTNIVGSGYIYGGHSDNSPSNVLTASNNDDDGYFGTGDGPLSPGDWADYYFPDDRSYKGQKRTLSFSNGQIIWDFAGNLYEHVNKANNLSGLGYNNNSIFNSNACGGNGWFTYYTHGTDIEAQCVFTEKYSYAKTWPLTPNLNTTNGIGAIISWDTVDNVMLRSSRWTDSIHTGIYTLNLNWPRNGAHGTVWFRCAK